uniref:PH domain-containing protein n=1 Tax=Timema shepardi TaxID=629360 RepID=A0A7R9ATZ2_TIMSH|nr:unnamed protein product [Timema shepardi]
MSVFDFRSNVTSDKLCQLFEGQLFKYTNVMKGWQYRWFVLVPEAGVLSYYLNETERMQRPRGSVHLAAAVISPSDEDSNTFTVNSATGEMFKLRASDARARHEWVSRIRAITEMHTMAIAHSEWTSHSTRRAKARRGRAQPTAQGKKGEGEWANHAARGPKKISDENSA